MFYSSAEEPWLTFLSQKSNLQDELTIEESIFASDNEILHALKYIADLRSIELGNKEAQYLLTYANRNISDLVKILESLDQLSMEMKRRITIPLIKQVI